MKQDRYDVHSGVVVTVSRSSVRLANDGMLSQWLMLDRDVEKPAVGDLVICRSYPQSLTVFEIEVVETGRQRTSRAKANRAVLASKQAVGEDVMQHPAQKKEPDRAV